MGAAGSDTALETADVALMRDDLTALPGFIELGRRTVNTIKVNVAFSIAVKALFLVLALTGVATLWMAVFADTGVALLVIANGMRLLRKVPARQSSPYDVATPGKMGILVSVDCRRSDWERVEVAMELGPLTASADLERPVRPVHYRRDRRTDRRGPRSDDHACVDTDNDAFSRCSG